MTVLLPGLAQEIAAARSSGSVPWSVRVSPLAARWLNGDGPPPGEDADPMCRRTSRALARRYGRFPGSFLLSDAPPLPRMTVRAGRDMSEIPGWVGPILGFGLLEIERSSRPAVLAALPEDLRAPTLRAFEVARVHRATRSDAPTGASAALRVAVEAGGGLRAIAVQAVAVLFGDVWAHELAVVGRASLDRVPRLPAAGGHQRERIVHWWSDYLEAELS